MNNNKFQTEEEEGFSIKPVIAAIFDNKWLIITFFALTMLSAYLINYYSMRIYSVSGSILIDARSHSPMNDVLLGSFQHYYHSPSSLPNTRRVFTARSTIERVIDKMDLSVGYKKNKGKFLSEELYKNTPFLIIGELHNPSLYNKEFDIAFLNENEFLLNFEFKNINISETFRYNELIENDEFSFRIIKNDKLGNKSYINDQLNSYDYQFWFNDKNYLIQHFRNEVNVITPERESSFLQIVIEDPVPERGVDFVNTLMDVFIELNLKEKAQAAENTINFIINQLNEFDTSLGNLETTLQGFKEQSGVVELSTEALTYFTMLKELDNNIVILDLQLQSLKMLEDYMREGDDAQLIAPSSLRLPEEVIRNQLNELINLLKERESRKVHLHESSPNLLELEKRIESTRKSLFDNIRFVRQGILAEKAQIRENISEIEASFKTIPAKELELLRLQRNFNVNEAIYLQFLEKKSEAEIAKAAIVADHRVVDYATTPLIPIKPDTKRIYIIAALLGLALPSGIIYLKNYFDDTIKDKFHLENYTKIPVIGIVGHNKNEINRFVADHPKSSISESFRSIRTNLQYLGNNIKENKGKLILVTSVVGGEGKSFSSINLASVIAFADKKVVIVGMDLRKPMLHKEFLMPNSRGISNYLIDQADLDDITYKSDIENMDIILSGPVPPNPSELLMSTRMEDLINRLREKYDYIIMDTPPVGLVTDANILMAKSDVILFIIRHNYSKIDYLSTINEIYDEGTFKNIYIILNDFSYEKSGYNYKYGYKYGYGYGYGYYEEDLKQISFFDSIKEKLKNTFTSKS